MKRKRTVSKVLAWALAVAMTLSLLVPFAALEVSANTNGRGGGGGGGVAVPSIPPYGHPIWLERKPRQAGVIT